MPALVPRSAPRRVANPKADPRFVAVTEQVKAGASKLKRHVPPAQKARETSKSAKAPPNERLAGAEAKVVDAVKEAPAPKPQPSSFKALLLAGNVGQQKQTTTGDVQLAGAGAMQVSVPQDPAEKEAERTAERILRMSEPRTPDRIDPAAAARTLRSPHLARMASGIVQGELLIARKQEGRPTVSSGLAAEISASQSAGSPLPSSTRRFMEPRFGADFSNVRVHTGEPAARMSRQLNAQAFTVGNQIFFGRNRFQPDTSEGKELIAHELTHTIQQGAAVQRSEDATVTQQTPEHVQRAGLFDFDPLSLIAEKANLIPGFRMFTIILGINPINMSRVDRSAANILRALIEFLPGGGLITQALENSGVFDKVGNWVEQQISTLGLVGSSIKQALTAFIGTLKLSDIGDLGGVWERAKRIFTEPIDRIINFAKGLVTDIIQFIKDAILMPLAKLAEGTRGWDLLCAVLGKNPITGDPVPRNAETLIGGFMKLVGQQDVWENMKKANAIGRAWAWFQGAMSALMGFVQQIPTLAINAFKALELVDIVLVPRAFVKVAVVFGNFIGNFISWGLNAVWNLLEIIFDVVSPGALSYIKRTGAALKSILKNPLPFVGNLVKAAKQGFLNFAGNFGTHLKAGLIDWLTGSLPGIYIPKAFSLQEIVKFVLSVLGLSWANVRQKLVKVVGETAVKAMETGFDIVVTLVTQGPAAAWDKIKDQLANLKDMVIGGITDFVVDTVVKKAIPKLIAMFIPGAGFISAILSIYDTIMVFVNKISKIIQVVTGFIDSIVAIAAGAIGAAATRVETTLAGLLSLAINFLAGFIGLGKVADKVMGVINKVRAPIDKALDWLINWIVTMAKKLGKMATKAAGAIIDWWKEKLGFTNKDGESHTLQFIGAGDSAQMGVATTLMPVRTYLDNHPDKGSPDWNTANSVFNAAMQVIFSPAAKSLAEKDRRAAIKGQLAKVSAAFAKLAGEPPTADDYGKNTPPTYGNPAKVDVIVGNPLTGSITGAWPTTLPGYKEIYDAGLTTATDRWVQMHIISEKLGGSGTDLNNLVPAPNSVNTGPFRSFEHSTAALAKAKSGNIKNRVWVEVSVSGTKSTATGISGKAGLYFWKGKKASPKWQKNESPSFTVSAGIPKPQLSGTRKLVLNFTSGTEMIRDFGISSATATLVKEGRPYQSQADFVKSMKARGATMGQINAVLDRGPVLNGP